MDVTGEQINASHQSQCAVPLILVIAHHGRAGARKRRAIRRVSYDEEPGIQAIGTPGRQGCRFTVRYRLKLKEVSS
jgi:hypothetical protein